MLRGVLVLALLCGACSYGDEADLRSDFVVFYAGGSTTLDATASATIARAARGAERARSFGVVVAGYADDPGAAEANQIQSRIRAQLVADALVRDGVARDRVTLMPRRALGGDPALESRRVDIRIDR